MHSNEEGEASDSWKDEWKYGWLTGTEQSCPCQRLATHYPLMCTQYCEVAWRPEKDCNYLRIILYTALGMKSLYKCMCHLSQFINTASLLSIVSQTSLWLRWMRWRRMLKCTKVSTVRVPIECCIATVWSHTRRDCWTGPLIPDRCEGAHNHS